MALAAAPALGRAGVVLLVGHVLAPRDRTAGVVVLLHGDVDHEAIGRRAVPVVLAGLEEDAVSRVDLLDGAALALAEADALGYPDRLPCGCVCQAVRAPGVKWTAAAANVELPAGAAMASM